jgi:hypothetical protein
MATFMYCNLPLEPPFCQWAQPLLVSLDRSPTLRVGCSPFSACDIVEPWRSSRQLSPWWKYANFSACLCVVHCAPHSRGVCCKHHWARGSSLRFFLLLRISHLLGARCRVLSHSTKWGYQHHFRGDAELGRSGRDVVVHLVLHALQGARHHSACGVRALGRSSCHRHVSP